MMKKLMATLLAGIMLFSIAGCGGEKTADGEKIVTLTWLVPGTKQADMDSVMEEVNKILVEKIGAKLDMQYIDDGAFQERMNMYMASGDDYDLAFTGYCNTYDNAVVNEALYPMTELINEYAPGLWDALPEYMWDFATINGEIYSVPNTQICSLPICMMVNKEVCDKYNFDFSNVKTIEDFEPFFEVIKQNEPGIYPYKPYHREYAWTYGNYESIAGNIAIKLDGSNELVNMNETPEFKRGREKFLEWVDKGYIRADVDTCGDDTADKMAGRYAFETNNYKPGIESEVKNQRGGREYEFVLLGEPFMAYNMGTATMIGIGVNSKNPDKAIQLIELLNTDKDFYNLICFGIEGKHYNLNDEGKVVFIEEGGYKPNAAWKFGNQFNALIIEGQDENVWEETKRMDAESIKSPLIGFFFNKDAVKTELAQIEAIRKEGEKAYTTEAWNAYKEKEKLAGVETVKAEVQKQVDAFFASK